MISIPSIYRAGKCFFVIQDAGRSICQKEKKRLHKHHRNRQRKLNIVAECVSSN